MCDAELSCVLTVAQVSWLVCMMCDLEFRTDQLVRKHSRGLVHQPRRTAVPAICYTSSSDQATSTSASTSAETQTAFTSESASTSAAETEGAAVNSRSVGIDNVDVTGGVDGRAEVCDGEQRALMCIGAGDETGKRRYECDVCNKLFDRSSNLITHRRTHTGEKPFTCMECGQTFNHSSNLISHRRIHTGQKPYTCDDCGRTFSQSTSLITHRRTHTGERPYVCHDCDQTFSQSCNLRTHRRRVHCCLD